MAEDNIIFVGTGGGRVMIANQVRATGGFIINLAGHQIFVDPGPGALVLARRCKIRVVDTDVVFVSHDHIDHANDINAIIDAMTLGGVNKKGILIAPPSITRGANNEPPLLRKFHREAIGECVTVNPDDVVKAGNLTFTATRTKHDAPDCIGFRLDSPAVSIGYTSDTVYFGELWRAFKGVKIFIINVLRPGMDKWKTHMCTDDAIKLVEKVKPELAIIQHFGMKMIKANPLYEARKIQSKTGVRTVAATDGLVVSLRGL